MPGVARPSFGSGDVIVRGAPTWDSKFYLDGVRIPQLYHMGGLKSTYNSEALQGLDFLPGGFGTRYGGATAGVIELKGRKAAEDRWHGNLDLSTIDGSFLVEGPINKKVSVLATARRSFVGDIAEWITKKYDDYFPMTMSTFYWDYVLRTDIKLSKNNNLFLTVFGSRDSLAMIFPDMQGGSKEIDEANNRLGTRTTSTMGLLGWDYNNGKHWSNSARYALSSVGSSFSTFGYWKSETEVWENYFRDQLTYSLSDNFKINAGLDINCANYDMKMAIIDGSYTIQRHNIKNWKFSDAGAYLNMEIKPTEKLTIYPGIRFDYYQELIHNGSIVPEFWNYSEFNNERGISGDPSLRINSKYEINEDHLVKLSIGNYNQTPQPIGQTIIKPWGEPSLPTTKAAHYVAGHEWKITDLISSDVQVYFNNQWDLPTYAENSDLSTDGGEQKAFNPNGRGRMYGLELMLRHMQSEHFFGWIAYTLSKTERKNMADDSWDLYDEDMTHNLQVLGSWHLRKQWDTGFRLRYVTGKPTTPVTGITYKENDLYYEPVYGKKNSSRMDPFFQLDLRVDKKFVHDKWMHSLYLDLQNVSYIFYKSPEYVQHNYNYKDSKNISMFPMLGIGFKAEF
jgi:hypothetical protein